MQPQPPSEFFLLLEAWWLGHIWRFPMFHKKTLNFPILLKQGCILQVNTVQYLYLQIVYLFEIIDEHCICFNVLVMAFGVFFESFFWQNFRCLFWTDGLMQWHFEDTAKHQSQEGWMACISYDAFFIWQSIRYLVVPFGCESMGILAPKYTIS